MKLFFLIIFNTQNFHKKFITNCRWQVVNGRYKVMLIMSPNKNQLQLAI